MKAFYIAPLVLKRVSVQLESKVLTGSVKSSVSSVDTKGQDVVQYDATSVTFNHDWEN